MLQLACSRHDGFCFATEGPLKPGDVGVIEKDDGSGMCMRAAGLSIVALAVIAVRMQQRRLVFNWMWCRQAVSHQGS